jgi:soluble lytic murein transglycosylase-like protein
VRLAEPPLHQRYPAPRYAAFDELIHEAAIAFSVPPALVKAVIAAESAFNPRAVSRKGAQGLMQLMPQTAATLGVQDPMEPTQNVRGGTTYLRAMIDRYGDLSRALAAYNAGPSAVDHYGGIPPYRETRAYVERVLTYYRSYHGDFIH